MYNNNTINKGWFKEGHKDLGSPESHYRASLKMRKEKHWNWKGGKPKCKLCGEIVSSNQIDNLLLCETQRHHNQVHTQMEIFVEKLIREGMVYYDRDKKEFRFR